MSRSRLIWLLLILLSVTLVVGFSGLGSRAWSAMMAAGDRFRAGMLALDHSLVEPGTEHADHLLRLATENAELRRRIREYDSLHAELGTRIFPEQLLRARVIARSAEQGRHFLEIDQGALQGISRGDPVVVGWTLVGVIRAEQAERSLVQLLTDSESRVAVSLYHASFGLNTEDQVSDSPVAHGVIAGSGDRHALRVMHVEARAGVQMVPGMQVLSSGLDPLIPFGLVIGEVVEAEPRADSDLWDITVQPARAWGSYPTVVAVRRLRALSEVPQPR